MRAMWKGAVAFGLVNVPIKLYAATEDHDVRFHQVHAADGGRIKMVRTCSIDGQPVEYKDLAKAYETDTGQVVIMDDVRLRGPAGARRARDRGARVRPERPGRPDAARPQLLPRAGGQGPQALRAAARGARRRPSAPRSCASCCATRRQLAALRVRDEVLVLQTMLWPDEVRAAEFDVLDTDVEIRPQELAMAAVARRLLARTSTPPSTTTSTARRCSP